VFGCDVEPGGRETRFILQSFILTSQQWPVTKGDDTSTSENRGGLGLSRSNGREYNSLKNSNDFQGAKRKREGISKNLSECGLLSRLHRNYTFDLNFR